MVTVLSLIQQITGRLAQPVPATINGNADKAIVQFKGLLEEGLDILAGRGQWQELKQEYVFTTLAQENQGIISEGGLGQAPVPLKGYRYLLPKTLWDRTNKLPLVGPIDDQDWQAMKAWIINGPRYQFRLRGRSLLVNPVPTAGWTWAFEYISENHIIAADLVTTKKRFTVDSDLILLPEQIVELDLKWRWKEAKGLPYAQDFENCERLVIDALARNQSARDLRMDADPEIGATPQIIIKPGSW